STCPRDEEFDDWPSLQKIPELVDSESAGLEESGATRIFNGFESLLIPGGRPNSMEFAISQACRLSKERPVIKRAPFSVDEIRMKGTKKDLWHSNDIALTISYKSCSSSYTFFVKRHDPCDETGDAPNHDRRLLADTGPGPENVVAQLLTDEEIIESVIGINKDDIDEEDDESSTMEPPSRNEAIKAAITLNNFLLSYEKTTPEVLTMLRKIRDEIQGEIDLKKKQKTIESFFKKPS
ncbi:hypothetical protein Tco_0248410, partial [Tanacetum coccineum]